MKLFVIIDKISNLIIGTFKAESKDVRGNSENEEVYEVNEDIFNTVKGKYAIYSLINDMIEIDTIIEPPAKSPTPKELTTQEQLDSMKEAIDFLIMGGM